MHEGRLLQHIADRSADLAGLSGSFGRVLLGPGDDCAVVETVGGQRWAYTVDQLVAGRHVDPGLPETDDGLDMVARKAVARSVSDLAAMGARPAWGLATGLIPAGWDGADRLFDAMARWARSWSCPLIGGDIATADAGSPLALTVTCAGTFDDGAEPKTRSGARPGDLVYVSGPLGGSLDSGRHLTFEPRVETGLAAATEPGVHAMIDLSDGLGLDADRVGRASGVRIVLETGSIPLHDDVPDGPEAWRAGAGDGEDHELMMLLDPGSAPEIAGRLRLLGPIGEARALEDPQHETGGATFREPDAAEHNGGSLGFLHGRDRLSP